MDDACFGTVPWKDYGWGVLRCGAVLVTLNPPMDDSVDSSKRTVSARHLDASRSRPVCAANPAYQP